MIPWGQVSPGTWWPLAERSISQISLAPAATRVTVMGALGSEDHWAMQASFPELSSPSVMFRLTLAARAADAAKTREPARMRATNDAFIGVSMWQGVWDIRHREAI